MAVSSEHIFAVADSTPLRINKIGMADLKHALARGFDDFAAMPSFAVFLCLIYPIVGLALGRAMHGMSLVPMLFPLAAGFALLGPLAATGLYEMSRRRERGLDTSPTHVFDIVHSPAIISVAAMGASLLVIFSLWLLAARAIFEGTIDGAAMHSVSSFIGEVFTTRAGLELIVIGNGVGFLFALAAFSVSVVSIPLILDRHVSATTAIATSLRAVAANPLVMAVWAFIIAGALVIGSIPFFMALIVVMPVLGHASWHLYRRVVAP